ncbi:hypothetical protein [Microtetraspora niveoalba]|uniref:hypothetical protein n=1 Tax=Microtetraspora niveoalba TaxID=46175 RepID=UPI00082C22E7|nr:hypothetical protein [Microtetraspora niveoalba]
MEWEPETLSDSRWRKLVPIGAALATLAGLGVAVLLTRGGDPGGGSPPSPPPQRAGAGWGSATSSASPSPSATKRSTAKAAAKSTSPQLTAKKASEIFDRFQHGMSSAQAGMDEDAIGKLEQGLAAEMTKASISTARLEGAKVASGMWPNTRVWVPRHIDGLADWFVAVSYEPEVARISDVMTKTGSGWRLVASAADARVNAAELPEIATDSAGYAVSLPENATGLVGTPRQIVRAHLASLEKAQPDQRFAQGRWTSEAALFWQRERAQLVQAGWGLTLSYEPEGAVRALQTTDGGALIWYAARSTETRTARRMGAKVSLKGSAAVRSSHKAFGRWVSATYGRMYVAYVPPAGTNDLVRVIGEWSEVLQTDGA